MWPDHDTFVYLLEADLSSYQTLRENNKIQICSTYGIKSPHFYKLEVIKSILCLHYVFLTVVIVIAFFVEFLLLLKSLKCIDIQFVWPHFKAMSSRYFLTRYVCRILGHGRMDDK